MKMGFGGIAIQATILGRGGLGQRPVIVDSKKLAQLDFFTTRFEWAFPKLTNAPPVEPGVILEKPLWTTALQEAPGFEIKQQLGLKLQSQ